MYLSMAASYSQAFATVSVAHLASPTYAWFSLGFSLGCLSSLRSPLGLPHPYIYHIICRKRKRKGFGTPPPRPLCMCVCTWKPFDEGKGLSRTVSPPTLSQQGKGLLQYTDTMHMATQNSCVFSLVMSTEFSSSTLILCTWPRKTPVCLV